MLQNFNSVFRLSIIVIEVIIFHLSVNTILLYGQENSDVKIGTQIWTSKNLDVSTFRNGEAIPEAKNAEEWQIAGDNETPAFCYYDFDSNNGKVYGKLYNWYAVNDPRGLAPKGYHIPSDAECAMLISFLGDKKIANDKMKSKKGWKKDSENNSGNGSNTSGFNALPSGYCYENGSFILIKESGGWWSNTENIKNGAWKKAFRCDNGTVFFSSFLKVNGVSVRCLKD
jgi:uncharacterized protein (TIGR02145 family)